MKKILLVSATKLPYNDKAPNPCFIETAKLGPNLALHLEIGNVDDYRIISNNSEGLCKVYNKFFDEKWKDWIVVFAHDDIEINSMNLKDRLNAALTRFDIVGVAGSATHSLKTPVLWHNSPRDDWSGAVEHPISKDSKSYHTNHFGDYPKPVMTLDGLFLAVNMEKALAADLKFDEQFDFHFYDLDFSVTAHTKGLNCGTWNIPITHYSHGDYRNPGWEANEEKYIKKWRE